MAKSYRVLLIDDHPSVRQGLQFMLQTQGIQIVAEADSCASTQALLGEDKFDLALLDLSLGDESGMGLISPLDDCGIAVLIYSMHEDPITINRAFELGAQGYVTKREKPPILFKAIHTVASGEHFVSPCALVATQETPPASLLSLRERQIFEMMGQGIGNKEIAVQLSISPRTVDTNMTRIVLKLGLDNRRALRKYAADSVKLPR
jgi:DNA-binding NarL/FixJ family response regulator